MKIASWNINGIAAHRRELIKFLTDVKPDVMCIQEIRGQIVLSTPGYHSFWFSAAEPNFSGTLVLSKREPLSVKLGIGIKSMTGKAGSSPQSIRIFILLMCTFRTTRRSHLQSAESFA